MNFMCLKIAENNFHDLDIMGAHRRKHSTFCEKKFGKEIRMRFWNREDTKV